MSSTLKAPQLSNHPVDIGQRSEGAIMTELIKRGYGVLLPLGVNQRYDLVIESEGRFLTAQCKTGRLRNGAVEFSGQSVQSNTRGSRRRSYAGQVDLFIVYCPANEGLWVIPCDEVPSTGMYLRVDPPRNRQSKRVRWAREYELPA
jgi:hypothetical protein